MKKNNYALIEVVDDKLIGNLMCLASIQHYQLACRETDIYIICSSANLFKQWYQQLGIQLLFIDEWASKKLLNVNSHQWSKFVYGRFMIFEDEIFKQYDVVAYADVDTVPLKPLRLSEFKDLTKIGMVPELDCRYIEASKQLRKVCEENNLQYTMKDKYCNAGMLYIPRCMLECQHVKDVLDMALQHTQLFPSNDQDIFNCLLGDYIEYLDPIYNLHPGTLQHKTRNETLKNVIVVHYAAISRNKKFRRMLEHLSTISSLMLDKDL